MLNYIKSLICKNKESDNIFELRMGYTSYYYNFVYKDKEYSFIYLNRGELTPLFSIINRYQNKLPTKFSILTIYEELNRMRNDDTLEGVVTYNNYLKDNYKIFLDIRNRFGLKKPILEEDILYNIIYNNLNELKLFDFSSLSYKEFVC
jgi:hypothetical protein